MSCSRLFQPVDDAHLAECAECRAVRDALQVPAGGDVLRLKAAALAELTASPKARPWWLAALGFLALCAVAVGAGVTLLSPNTVQHASVVLQQASSAAWAALMVASVFLAVMPGARSARTLLLGAVAACFALTLVAASGHDPGVGGAGCAIIEWSFALLPLGVAVFVLSGFSFDPLRAVAAGFGATSAGMLAVHLHCPNGTLVHQAAFHLAPMVVLAAVAVVVRRMVPSRSHAP